MRISRRLGKLVKRCPICKKEFKPFHAGQETNSRACMMKLRWKKQREKMLASVKKAMVKSVNTRVQARAQAAVKDLIEGRITPLQFYNRAWTRGYKSGWDRRDQWYGSDIQTTRRIQDQAHYSESDPVYRRQLRASKASCG